MSEHSRTPIYATNNPSHRIVSVPNGLWRRQEHANAKGTKTFDPWVFRSPAMTLVDAHADLNRFALKREPAPALID